MVSRATKKPSLLCWLLAFLLGLVVVSTFTGTALWLGAGDDPAVFAVETVVPGIVRVDDSVRPAAPRPGDSTAASVEREKRPRAAEASPPPDVTASPASTRETTAQDDLQGQTRDASLTSNDPSYSHAREDLEVQLQGHRIPSGESISLTKRGQDYQNPQSASEEEEHNETFMNTDFQPMLEYYPGLKRTEVPGGPVRRFDEELPESWGHASPPGTYDGEAAATAENPMLSFLQRKLQELHDWLSADDEVAGKRNGTRLVAEFKDVLAALNGSIAAGDPAQLLGKLKQLYQAPSSSSAQLGVTDPAVIGNTSSLVSFGLLAFDLLLLHNVQHIAWEEERLREAEMLRDPEVLALNALFMPPDKVREMLDPLRRSGDHRHASGQPGDEERTIGQELVEFASGAVRGVLNLGRAYRHSAESARAHFSSGTPLDCIWTLYCRNLDKTSRLRGPYGFLAKMNSFGLRLVMGEFSTDSILESVVREFATGWSHINCQKLFPRCSVKDATSVVLKSVLRDEATV